MKSFNQVRAKIPIAKLVLFGRLKNLNSATIPQRKNFENFSYETIEKLNIYENFSQVYVISCLRKIQNGKSAGHEDVFPEFLKYAHEYLNTLITRFFKEILEVGLNRMTALFPCIAPFIRSQVRKIQIFTGVSSLPDACVRFSLLLSLKTFKRVGKHSASRTRTGWIQEKCELL